VVGQREDDTDGEAEVRCELTELSDKLSEIQTRRSAVTSQLETADAAVRDASKRVCRSYIHQVCDISTL